MYRVLYCIRFQGIQFNSIFIAHGGARWALQSQGSLPSEFEMAPTTSLDRRPEVEVVGARGIVDV